MTKRTRIAPHDVCRYACLRPDELERQGGPAPLQRYYAGRRAEHQDYVQRYFTGSWEEAAERWWTGRLQSEHSHTSVADSR
ncbi:MAG TPA: hypothetical protein VE268_05255 [Herpetosiphonaceae bacterium]|nr:hypothetical protein [Herpetosiphonaceae bacterium]